jgi:hypothetical protein
MKTQKLKKSTVVDEKVKVVETNMSLQEATTLLKKLGEWETVWHLDRDTIIKWASFLKEREKL